MRPELTATHSLAFEGVTVRFGHGRRALTAVNGVSLTVPAGTITGLVGESGCGKSTLARAAAGLVPLSAGRVLVGGHPMPASLTAPARRSLQMVFQDPYSSLDPRMRIGDSIAEAIRGIPRGAARNAEVARLLGLVQLAPDRAAQYPAQLSGGQRQRVALARALAARPSVIIADEITSALDVSVQGAVLNLLRDLQRDLGLTVLFISHNLAVVRYVSDSIAVMYQGEIAEAGEAAAVLANAQHPYTQQLLAAAPRPGVRLSSGAPSGPAMTAPSLTPERSPI